MLFIGETWNGSSARSMRGALADLPDVEMDDVGEDHYFPKGRSLAIRASNRILRPWQRAALESEIYGKLAAFKPDVLLVYKGSGVSAAVVRRAKLSGVFTVNIFPDYSPHAYGIAVRRALEEYDLVISTKPFHPAGWWPTYGYGNACVCVPHGYDPAVHLWPAPSDAQDLDLALAATWRPEYHELMQHLAVSLAGLDLRVGIIGAGWVERANQFPSHWELSQSRTGRSYGEWLRRGRIVIAPVNLDVVISGLRQPGDEESTRTYELAAMGCFFLHRRTPFVQTIYDEAAEVPMWNNANELAELVRRFLPLEASRRAMAARAHAKAVPAYSIPNRASQVLEQLEIAMGKHSKASR